MSVLRGIPFLDVVEVRITGFKVSESGETTMFESVSRVQRVMAVGDTLNISFSVTDEGIELAKEKS